MIRVTAASPFMVEAREFKTERGINSYLRGLKRLQKAHIERAVKKELGPCPGSYTARNFRREYRRQYEKICESQPLKISIVHV